MKIIPQNVIGTVYNSNLFTHSKENKKFISEISDTPEVLRQLWNDSMDCGFGIRSVRTGNIVFWTLCEIKRDSEGEILSWIFLPNTTAYAVSAYVVEILND